MISMAKILLVFGIANIFLSSIMYFANSVNSAERSLCIVNIVIGAVMMILSTVYLAYKKQKSKKEDETL